MTFATRVKKAREHAKLSQAELARRLGLKPQAIQYLEEPKNNARGSKHTAAIARECGVDPNWLGRGEGTMLVAAQARQPEARYGVSPEALEVARAFDQLQPQARAFIREQVFIYTVIDKSFPWLRHGKPMGTSYEDFEKWHQRNIAATRDLEDQRAGVKPREIRKREKERTAK